MLTKGFLKPLISIERLGRRQFWTGIIIGVGVSFVLSYFFNYSREALRTITFFGDPLILTEKEFRTFDLFFATFASSIGFGFTIIHWLRGRNQHIKKNYLKTFALSNAWFVAFVALMLVSRFGSVLPIIMYGLHGYDNHLDLLHEFNLLFLLIPLYVFFAQWNTIRLIFRTRFWVLLSIVFYASVAFYLYKTTYPDRDILNDVHFSRNKNRFDYIDSAFQSSRKHEIFFNDTIRQILEKRYAERTTYLVHQLKQAFKTDNIVPLDTLILEKIVTHNMNRHLLEYFGKPDDKDKNWPYALPEELYFQIQKHDVNSIEIKVLFDILHEQISLFTAPEIAWDDSGKYSDYEREKSFFMEHLYHRTETIQSRLIQVVEKLKSSRKYEKYHHLLPDMKFNAERGQQKYFRLYLTESNSNL